MDGQQSFEAKDTRKKDQETMKASCPLFFKELSDLHFEGSHWMKSEGTEKLIDEDQPTDDTDEIPSKWCCVTCACQMSCDTCFCSVIWMIRRDWLDYFYYYPGEACKYMRYTGSQESAKLSEFFSSMLD